MSILVLIPTGRDLVNALRSRGFLALTVTAVFLALLVLAYGAFGHLRRKGQLTPRSASGALVLVGAIIGVTQLLPRAEERWHVVQYAVLGGLLFVALGRGIQQVKRRALVSALLVGVAGWLDEGIQYFLPERVYDNWDVALNAAAGFAGVGVALLLAAVSRRDCDREDQRTESCA